MFGTVQATFVHDSVLGTVRAGVPGGAPELTAVPVYLDGITLILYL